MKIRIELLVFVVLIVSQFEVSCLPLNLNKIHQIASNAITTTEKNYASLTNRYNVWYSANEDKVELQKNEKEFMQVSNGVENIGKRFTF